MSSSEALSVRGIAAALSLGAVLALVGCTVQPLAGSSANYAVATPALRSIAVDEVGNRPAQRVRNALLFALHGGVTPTETRYRLGLDVTVVRSTLAITNSTLAPTASQLVLTTAYVLRDARTGAVVSSGQQRSVAAFDETSQSFADTRALRDAENRAASEAAQRIRLALARDLSRGAPRS